MITLPPPMSNAQRQRKFQQANPGYDRQRKARERGMARRELEQMQAALQAEALAQQAQTAAAEAAQTMTATIQIPANKPLLMLPAPIKDQWMAEIEALAAARKSQAAESPFVPVFTKSPAACSR
jgi:hypothetical protein